MNKNIYITQPFLPPLEEFQLLLKEIWESKWLTNNGKFHMEFEEELASFLGVRYVSLFTNGTLALITALQALRISGEVLTTPYSFVATTHALKWNGINPVFVDIEEKYCNIDASKIEAAITPKTTAILPVHVYGNPCDVDKIQEIADTYGLKVLYDAAHSFGVKMGNESVLNFGDLSVLSFHATKAFNTFEGGAIICHDAKTKKRIDYLKNFGIADEVTVVAPGINAKMTEFQAALGLLQLKYFNDATAKAKIVAEKYRTGLSGVAGIKFIIEAENVKPNYSYFPIFIDKKIYGKTRDDVFNKLKELNIITRKYFYPLISSFSPYKGIKSSDIHNLTVANKVADQVLCLPIYPDIEMNTVNTIINLLKVHE